MGSYLATPVYTKISSDELDDKLKSGASSMQGWRISQEDAHNCILSFDINTSFFAVYDGHGGHEVAQYCSENLPQFIKDTQAYKDGDINKALIEGFLGFDALIASKKVVDILKKIAGEKDPEVSVEEENVDNLYEEAAMPIEQVIEKYTNLVNPAHKALIKTESDKFPKSPFLKAKKEGESSVASSSSEASNSKINSSEGCSSNSDEVSSSSNDLNEAKTVLDVKDESERHSETNGSIPDIIVTSSDSPDCKEAAVASSNSEVEVIKEEALVSIQNGEISEAESKNDVTSSSVTQENGEVTVKGKGKALAKTNIAKTPVKIRPKRNAKQLYTNLLNFEDDSEDTEDEEDKNFEGPSDASSDDDDDEGVNLALKLEGWEESSVEEEGDEEEDEEEGDLDDDDEEYLEFGNNMKEEPGSDSGCTAVVALLRENELYVANAGDSRCIICRNGKAVEMSFDHKPEDEPERARIIKAGGKVTTDGRVNGGLNLSRAIGDHAYKQNKELSDREQMITALPDIKSLTVNPAEDEFMVLACDGIWNSMSSQEVVDFVKPRIENCEKLSRICEEMFDHCLAPDTLGDGTGCDNMTAIIVQFKSNILKRAASPQPAECDSKRAKTEENESHIDTTA